jgi:hypothetical protein
MKRESPFGDRPPQAIAKYAEESVTWKIGALVLLALTLIPIVELGLSRQAIEETALTLLAIGAALILLFPLVTCVALFGKGIRFIFRWLRTRAANASGVGSRQVARENFSDDV